MKLNVALISLARRGGMIHYNAELANALADITPITAITAKAARVRYFSPKVNRLALDTGNGVRGTLFNAVNPSIYYKIIKMIRDDNIDLVHITGPHEWNPILGLLIKLLARIPLVYTVHDPKHHEGIPLYFKIPEGATRKIVDAIVVHTKSGKEHMSNRQNPYRPIAIMPMGLFSMFGKHKKDDIIEGNEILFFGRIEPYKGLDVLLEAAPMIFNKLPDWRIVIAGSGSLSSYENLINDNRIRVINRYINDEEVQQLMRAAKMVVMPYKNATQSGIIPVAFALSKPVIATNVGGLPDVIINGKTGLLIQPNDKNALADAVIKLANDNELRQRLAHSAHEMGETELSWSKIARKHVTFYKSILNP